jgi:hypothetical protein
MLLVPLASFLDFARNDKEHSSSACMGEMKAKGSLPKSNVNEENCSGQEDKADLKNYAHKQIT